MYVLGQYSIRAKMYVIYDLALSFYVILCSLSITNVVFTVNQMGKVQ